MQVQSNTPSAGWITWSNLTIQHMNITYNISDGSSNYTYLWWDYDSPNELQESNTMPALTDNDAIVFVNDGGTYHIAGVDSDIHGLLLVAGSVPSSALDNVYIAGQFIFTVPGTLAVEANPTVELFASATLTITEVFASVKVTASGNDIIVDVNKNGTTIFTTQANRPTIAEGDTSDTSGTPDVTGLVSGDKLTIDVDQVGSVVAGEDLTVCIRFTQNVS